ncbi:MAG: hypothetical protein IAG13_15820 [Deltaproteobacteria bacterium]|nr:hypothetical protein [Nannocystaceae bacterium]
MIRLDLTPHEAGKPLYAHLLWVCVVACAAATFYIQSAIGITCALIAGLTFAASRLVDGQLPETPRLRHSPLRELPTELPARRSGRQTVVAKLLSQGESLLPPWEYAGHIVAWSVDDYEYKVGWNTISSMTTISLETSEGVRFGVELDDGWVALTSQQRRIRSYDPMARMEAAERCLERSSAASDEESRVAETKGADFLAKFAKRVAPSTPRVQSVFLSDQVVAITGRFVARGGSPGSFPSYARGEEFPVYALQHGTIDDLSLDHAWRRRARNRYYVAPGIAFLLAAIGLVVAVAVT